MAVTSPTAASAQKTSGGPPTPATPAGSGTPSSNRRWLALVIVCLAQLMIVLDTTIVNVALPAIQRDLHFSPGDLSWVVNAFLLTFGSFLLLAGRLGDLLGRKQIFMAGLVIFTLASIACGAAPSEGFLIGARFVQGLGAALQGSVILAIIVTQFPETSERAKAMSAYVFTSVSGGSIGLLAGGALTQGLSWHWIFFVNVPIGLATLVLGAKFVPRDRGLGIAQGVDWLGSMLVTIALAAIVYAIVSATTYGFGSAHVLAYGGGGLVLLALFLVHESRSSHPIMPLRILRVPGLGASSAVRAFLTTGMYSSFFLGTLYLEQVRGYTALQTGLAFLPWTLVVTVLSLGVTARLVRLMGPLRLMTVGMAILIGGLLLFRETTVSTGFFPLIFFANLAIGLGIGLAFMPLLQVGMARVPPQDAGLASGIINVSQQIGGALGLALLSTVATNHTKALEHAGVGPLHAVVGGDHVAFLWGIGAAALGLALAWTVLRRHGVQTTASSEAADAAESASEMAERASEVASEIPGGVAEPVEVAV
jgi:EmrB/QacA subfamily drug resistance transporter